jgi:hypothetical protein
MSFVYCSICEEEKMKYEIGETERLDLNAGKVNLIRHNE